MPPRIRQAFTGNVISALYEWGNMGNTMDSALIVSYADKSTAFFKDLLKQASIGQVAALRSCGDARRLLLGSDFDLVIINAPLHDESGEDLARYIASKGISQVMLVVKNEYFEEASAVCEKDGVLMISKPINKAFFWSALMLAKSMDNRIKHIQAEKTSLLQKIEDIRIVDRAKCILISHMNMSEQEAHRYIEKQAMDMRATKRIVAERILEGI